MVDGTDPAGSLKPFVSDETFYNDGCSCSNIFLEELVGVDCRVDNIELFRGHLRRQETFPTIAYIPAHKGGTEAKRCGCAVQNITNVQLFLAMRE